MNITIPCEQFARMASIPATLDTERPEQYLRSLYFESTRGKLFIVATNAKIAAIECVENSGVADGSCAVVVTPELIDVCERETAYNGAISISVNDALNWTVVQTQFGFKMPTNGKADLPNDHHFATWRDWFPDKMPTKSSGGMHWEVTQIETLSRASISGSVTFPEFIDVSKPVIVNDLFNPLWCGLFMPTAKEKTITPATRPVWSK